ncbi:MAG: methionine biosynthesis protein MetW [Rickettsiales bacterium]
MVDTDALRADLAVMADWIVEGSRVLDAGCGDGALLHWLVTHKQADARGIEISQPLVADCIAKGLSVMQGDADEDLAYYPDNSFDYVVMGHALQRMQRPDQTLQELMRIGKQVLISLPNFAHWKNRLYLLANGRMPVTGALAYEWYETPNIHFCSLTDFVKLCDSLGIAVERELFITRRGKIGAFSERDWLANFFGEQGVFLLRKK